MAVTSRFLGFGIALSLVSVVAAQRLDNPGHRRERVTEVATRDEAHSEMGEAFNYGPRFPLPLRAGVGTARLTITTQNPEAQAFFNQGLNLVHSFEWVEAERAFRQAVILDPQAPMPYWGLALSDANRSREFIQMAMDRIAHATDYEARFIRALHDLVASEGNNQIRRERNIEALREIVATYPDDIEGRAFLAWVLVGVDRIGRRHEEEIERLFAEVFARDPKHPGAHHYRIHMYDERRDAGKALVNADAYLEHVTGVGHAQHMPGHIYASVGRWHQAAIAQDRATRVERQTFAETGNLPFHSWNFAHNQEYLISNLGYLGRIEAGLRLAQEMADMPRDPRWNSGTGYSIASRAPVGRLRMLLRAEDWVAIEDGYRETGILPASDLWRPFALGHAALARRDLDAARFQLAELKRGTTSVQRTMLAQDLEGRILVSESDVDAGIAELVKAAATERPRFLWGDPPSILRPIYESLAEAYLESGRYEEADRVLAEALVDQPENAFALAQRIRALLGLGKIDEALALDQQLFALEPFDTPMPALARLQNAWTRHAADADAIALRWEPAFADFSHASYGPTSWEPNPAPPAVWLRPDGSQFMLDECLEAPVVLIFYLGGSCLHCMEQVAAFDKARDRFTSLGVRIVASSPDSPEQLHDLTATHNLGITLVSDPEARAAKAFRAYDLFEDRALHATFILGPCGKIWWYDIGVNPFENVDFVLNEVQRAAALRSR